MTTFLDKIRGRTRVVISETERALHLYKGELQGILGPGEHSLKNGRGSLVIERQSLATPQFRSAYEKALFDKLPEVAEKHLTVVRTNPGEVAIVERDNRIHAVLGPDERQVFWTDAGPWTWQVIDTEAEPELPQKLMRRLGDARQTQQFVIVPVTDGSVALLSMDGVMTRVLDAGIHAFWKAGRTVTQRVVDLKRQSLDVTGQEVLTLDRVTIRINLSADYRVVDPVKAATEVKDFTDTLYRALQLVFRKQLGALKLDQILERKGEVNAEATGKIKADMAEIGIEVSDIVLKDVILPGEMRDILNMVVTAEKEAEANVIRRREETNATRSLLNTAKVMAENPVMLRLKELEALESIADKVDRLTVHNGTGGLMNDLVRLRDEGTA
ncbi:MAG: slipin family protein [Roseibium sp.]|uniref:slipin family protein n=1 Tax=Roseibium sp. TaxID=1936156 RepID=UPI001B196B7E|nr:slipin family protein [Roseibium sp.]MBO6894930.1 slipin family protein [Roseibium sp.]MBO6930820.1 slipin family protein [Roseibium sp.]